MPDDSADGIDPESGRRFVVCGDNALARRLITELVNRYGVAVTVLLPSLVDNHAPDIVEFTPDAATAGPRPEVVVARRLTAEVLDRAGVRTAAAVALVSADDVANVDAALIIREFDPEVRVVVRLFNSVLGEGVAAMLGDCAVLSGSEIAAPAFVAATLGDDTPTFLRLPDDELLRTASRAALDPDNADVVCALADTSGPELVTLPEDEDSADLVLVRAYGRRHPAPARPRRRLVRTIRLVLGRRLRWALGATAALLAVASVLLGQARDIDPVAAGYLTLLTALGSAEADQSGSLLEKVTALLLVIVGVALVPTVTALVVDSVVRARLAVAAGRLTDPLDDHVIVVGLGNIGTRVVQELHSFGVPVVAVDRAPTARGVAVARELGLPVLIGDATSPETLRAASVSTCRALVVLCTDDVTNLETALLGRSLHRAANGEAPAPLRVVLRLFDEEFAQRVQRAFGINHSRSVSYLAAPAFAAAMMGREVIDTISVGRRVLLVAELPVALLAGPLLVKARTQQSRQLNWVHLARLDDLSALPGGVAQSSVVGGLLVGVAVLGAARLGRRALLPVSAVLLPVLLLFAAGAVVPLWVARYLVFVVPFACLLAGAALAAVPAPAALVVVVLAGLLGLPDQAALRRTHEWPRSAPVDYAGAARVIADGQHPGDAVVYSPRHSWLFLDLGIEYHLDDPPRDVLVTEDEVRRGDLWAAECPQPAQCLAGTTRVWLVVSGRRAEPLAAVPGAKGDALRAGFTVAQVWQRPGLTVALLTSRADR
ncbi:NAD-binding protein [Micromonospora sp. STR1s_6]|uniref:NAD-binding protein n=1 Tax=Micromonospora tarensis TaxID=2806100 RepID=A0ABS1YNY2_9ACTN|nr:NAD-binding protein [Micromonospora tarensis]